ncbi:MAG: site-specific integrase [Betaproteobacteria bacterium]|nr:MAG: site-specific integrase [Betaproteobacteria bacterium]
MLPRAEENRLSRATHINFTKTAIAALPAVAAEQRATYYDVKTRGLVILVTPRGAKTFYVRRKIKGRTERIHIGRFPEWTVERARARADEINAAFGRGDNPAEARRVGRAEMTLNDLFAEYISRNGPHLRRPDKPKNNYRLYLGHWGGRKLSTIKHHEVDSWHKQLARGKSNVTANIALKLLHVMFNKAIHEWRIWTGDNPAHGIRKLREKSRERFLQPAEMPFFMMAVAAEPNSDLRDLIQLALLTGARRANLVSMRWDQLSLDDQLWRIPETKNGTPQLLPLSPEATQVLRARGHANGCPWVFPGTGTTGHTIEPKRGWLRIKQRTELLRLVAAAAEWGGWREEEIHTYTERALLNCAESIEALRAELKQQHGVDTDQYKLQDLRFHDLRRTLGSWQARMGASLAIIGKSLHHKSPVSTAVYARLDLDPVRASIDRATAAMWKAAGISENSHDSTREACDLSSQLHLRATTLAARDDRSVAATH